MYADFDTGQPPFSLLSAEERERLLSAMDIQFFPSGEVIIEPGSETSSLYVVDKGLVEESDPAGSDGDSAVARYRAGELFGFLALLRGRARHRYVAMEDTLCHLAPRKTFLDLVNENAEFGGFFYRDLATKTKLVAQSGAYRDLVSFNMARVNDECMRSAVVIPDSTDLRDAVEQMRVSRVDSLLVRRGEGDWGIVTRTDLLEALALQHHGLDAPVGDVASWNLVTVNEGDFLFDALIRMTGAGIERLVVMDEGRPAGLVELADILGFLSSHSHVIALRVAQADSFESLRKASAAIPDLARSLFAQRVGIRFIMDLLAVLHRRIIGRHFHLTTPAGVAEESCLLVLGSEGRGEQVMRTDQNHALILAGENSWPDCGPALESFTLRMQALGYPPSERGILVSNPEWRLSAEQWQQRLEAWASPRDEDAIYSLSAFLDATPVGGNAELFEPLREYLYEHLSRGQAFFGRLAWPAVEAGAPPPFYDSGGRGREIDVKRHGIFPIVHGARTLALEHSLEASNTFLRLEGLRDAAVLDEELAGNLSEAFTVLNQIRLGQQLARLEEVDASRIPAGTANIVHTERLSSGETQLLREAFRTVRDFRDFLQRRYGL
ncbi:MAG: putative nucleotidyltransferase substrate binding domain-containing protein [Gammaproteobacteria bacterium]